MTRLDALKALAEKVEAECVQLRRNAQTAGKEGWGTHRPHGAAGRVAALWIERRHEVLSLRTLIAQEEGK